MATFTFKCFTCGQDHLGMPSFGAPAPLNYYAIPEPEREERCDLASDACVIDGTHFFIRGCLDIPVHGEEEPFSWGVWVSLSEANFSEWSRYFDEPRRTHLGPYFGWLNAWLKPYPDTM